MSSDQKPLSRWITVVWEFEVDSERESAFRSAYGVEGGWVQLFRTGEGYLGTELIYFDRHRYLTLDSWATQEAYEHFKAAHADAYAELDKGCETLTVNERFLGIFENSTPAALLNLISRQRDVPEAEGTSLRVATAEDITAMIAIALQVPLAARWSRGRYEGLFSDGASTIALVMVSGQDPEAIYGFVVGRLTGEECELENIAVSPWYQLKGFGRQLLRAFIDEAIARSVRQVFLEVRETNAAARRLYASAGFEVVGRRKGYYSEPVEDALLYRLSLKHQ